MFYIKSRVQFEGIHYWPSAYGRVSFLSSPHRHIFTVIATKKVSHADRDTEFICLKRDITNWLADVYKKQDECYLLGQTSCEMLAERIAKEFKCIDVEVWEDSENCGGYSADE